MVHGLVNSKIRKEDKRALFKAIEAKQYELKDTSVKIYEVERYQGFHLVYENVIYHQPISWLHRSDSTLPSEYTKGVIVKTLIHVFDPKWPPNKKIKEQISHLPRIHDSVFVGAVVESTDVMTDIFDLLSLLDNGWKPKDDQEDHRLHDSRLQRTLSMAYALEVENGTDDLLAYDSSMVLEAQFIPLRSFRGLDFAVSFESELDVWTIPLLEADSEICRSYEDMVKTIWDFCLQSMKHCDYVIDVSIGHDPIACSIVQQLTKVARILIAIDSGGNGSLAVIQIDAQIPLGKSLLEYCIGKHNHKTIAHMVNNIEMNRQYCLPGTINLLQPLWDIGNGCYTMGLFSLLKHHINIKRLRYFVNKILRKAFLSSLSRRDPFIRSLRNRGDNLFETTPTTMLYPWAGEQFSVEHIQRKALSKLKKHNDTVFLCCLSISFANNPLYFTNHSEAFTKSLIVGGNVTAVAYLVRCLSLYRPTVLPTLQELTRAAIRQHLCRGFSILPKIGEFVTAGILPKRLVEYVFLCHEMSAVCPKIAEDIQELTK